MDDIKVRVRQEMSGNALPQLRQEMQQARAEMERLRLEEDRLRATGDKTGADQARTGRLVLQRTGQLQQRLGLNREDASALARENVEHRNKIREEGGHGHSVSGARLRNETMTAVREAVLGGLRGSTLGAIGGALGPYGALATAAFAGIELVNKHFERVEKREAFAEGLNEERTMNARRTRIIGLRGSASEAGGASEKDQQEVAEREAKRGSLELSARPGIWDPRRWSNALLGTKYQTADGKQAISENEQQIGEARSRAVEHEKLARQLLANTEGKDLKALEADLRGRHREAIGLRLEATHEREKRRLLNLHFNASEAEQGADLKVEQERRRAIMGAAKAINTRSGNSDIARASFVATHDLFGAAGIKQSVDKLHDTVAAQAFRAHFNARSSRPRT